jgi:hypothetical protein
MFTEKWTHISQYEMLYYFSYCEIKYDSSQYILHLVNILQNVGLIENFIWKFFLTCMHKITCIGINVVSKW